MSDFLDAPVEIVLLTINECFVYKVPPLRTASGHRAEDWDLANPILTGCLKVFQADTKLRIVLYSFKDPSNTNVTAENINPIGECPIDLKPGDNVIGFVDAVIDSSRYYVLRIKDPNSSRSTLLGVGFRERDQAFDFKNCLNDHVKFLSRMQLASQLAAAPLSGDLEEQSQRRHSGEYSANGVGGDLNGGNPNETGSFSALGNCPSDNSQLSEGGAHYLHVAPLKEGEKIRVRLGKPRSRSNSLTDSNTAGITSSAKPGTNSGMLLKPPPAPGSTVTLHVGGSSAGVPVSNGNSDGNDDDDWGDFSGPS